MMNDDDKWMHIAINEANLAINENEVPVGAALVFDGKLIAKAHNQPIALNDPTAHAEIQLLRSACKITKNYRQLNTTMYVTLEPCAMCLGAMVHARIKRLVFGAYDYKSGVCGSCANLANEKFFNHKILIEGGFLENQCSSILRNFFKLRRSNIHTNST
jgi:tRNA(adenine34) deaminase